MSRYSAPGLYTNIGLYWLFPSTAIEKSDTALNRLELLPLDLSLLFKPSFLAMTSAWVQWGARMTQI